MYAFSRLEKVPSQLCGLCAKARNVLQVVPRSSDWPMKTHQLSQHEDVWSATRPQQPRSSSSSASSGGSRASRSVHRSSIKLASATPQRQANRDLCVAFTRQLAQLSLSVLVRRRLSRRVHLVFLTTTLTRSLVSL